MSNMLLAANSRRRGVPAIPGKLNNALQSQPIANPPIIVGSGSSSSNSLKSAWSTKPFVSLPSIDKSKHLGGSDGSTGLGDGSGEAKVPGLGNGPAQAKRRQKPDWDPFFWKKEEANKEAHATSNSKQPPLSANDGSAELFATYPKIQEFPVSPPQPKSLVLERKRPLVVTKKLNLSPPLAPENGDSAKFPKTNYRKWWENLLNQDQLPSGGTSLPVFNKLCKSESKSAQPIGKPSALSPIDDKNCRGDEIVRQKRSSTHEKRKTEVTDLDIKESNEEDDFVLQMADMSELVEFAMYKCAAESCLPILPELLQELDDRFQVLVIKYLDQKNAATSAKQPQLDSSSAEMHMKMLKEVTEIQNDLEAQNSVVLNANTELRAEIKELKNQIKNLQHQNGSQQDIECSLRNEIEMLKTPDTTLKNNINFKNFAFSTTNLPKINLDTIQYKMENEALKLINTKLRHESEMNNRILGVIELNYLYKNFKNQEQHRSNLTSVATDTSDMATAPKSVSRAGSRSGVKGKDDNRKGKPEFGGKDSGRKIRDTQSSTFKK